MSTYTQIYYHVVFSTKDRARVLRADHREELFKYILGLLKNHQCHLFRINGVEDHIHLLIGLHPTVSLASLIKDIKVSSSAWIKENNLFPGFTHWQEGYGAFTISNREKDAVIEYIKAQEEHHRTVSFPEELKKFMVDAGIEFDERYFP